MSLIFIIWELGHSCELKITIGCLYLKQLVEFDVSNRYKDDCWQNHCFVFLSYHKISVGDSSCLVMLIFIQTVVGYLCYISLCSYLAKNSQNGNNYCHLCSLSVFFHHSNFHLWGGSFWSLSWGQINFPFYFRANSPS